MALMMKTKSLLLPLVLFSFIVFGCGFSDDEDPGRRPVVGHPTSFYKDTPTSTISTFNVGDEINIKVTLEDPDLDIVTLFVTIYDYNNLYAIYDGPNAYELDPVQLPKFTVLRKLDVALPVGEYRVDFQAVDEKGHASQIEGRKLWIDSD